MDKVEAVTQNNDWSNYSDDQLELFSQMIRGEGISLLLKHIAEKSLERKMWYYEKSCRNSEDLLDLNFIKGYVTGLDYVADLPNQIQEEIDRRKDLQKK